MSFTYNNPAASLRDAVRFEIQDTSSSAPLLQDEEIEYALAQECPARPPSEGELLSAAARCMEVLARLFAAQADTTVGTLQATYSKSAAGYVQRAKELRLRAQGMRAPWAGGQSEAEKRTLEAEVDRVQPAFTRREFNNPYAGRPGDGVRSGEGGH